MELYLRTARLNLEDINRDTEDGVHLCGLQDCIWHSPKKRPKTIQRITVDAMVEERIRNAFVASPDMDGGAPARAQIKEIQKERGIVVRILVDRLDIWDVIFLEKSHTSVETMEMGT